MNEIKSYTFYRNYYELIKHLPSKERLQMYDAISQYMFENIEPNLNGLCNGIWVNLKMPLDTSKMNIENGRKGGAPIGNQNALKKQPKNNPKTTEKQPKNNRKTTEGTTEKQANNISNFLFLISNFKFNNNINNLLKEYLEVRVKNKYTITESIVNRLCNKLNQYSTNDEEKEEIILNAINGAWKDFYPLKKETQNNTKDKLGNFNKVLKEVYDGTIEFQ